MSPLPLALLPLAFSLAFASDDVDLILTKAKGGDAPKAAGKPVAAPTIDIALLQALGSFQGEFAGAQPAYPMGEATWVESHAVVSADKIDVVLEYDKADETNPKIHKIRYKLADYKLSADGAKEVATIYNYGMKLEPERLVVLSPKSSNRSYIVFIKNPKADECDMMLLPYGMRETYSYRLKRVQLRQS